MDSASVHGMVSFVSGVKVSQQGSNYFNATPRSQSSLLVLRGAGQNQRAHGEEAGCCSEQLSNKEG